MMKRGVPKNLCNDCPITAWTTCSLQQLAYERHGWDGMAKCETRDDVVKMLQAMKGKMRMQAVKE